MKIGHVIKQLRKQKGVTQMQVADAVGIGYATIAYYETDKCLPSLTVLVRLADYFDVTLDELVDRVQ